MSDSEPHAFANAMAGGSIGVYESFIQGKYQTSDLASLTTELHRLALKLEWLGIISLPGRLARLARSKNDDAEYSKVVEHYHFALPVLESVLRPTYSYSAFAVGAGISETDLVSFHRAYYDGILNLASTSHPLSVLNLGAGLGAFEKYIVDNDRPHSVRSVVNSTPLADRLIEMTRGRKNMTVAVGDMRDPDQLTSTTFGLILMMEVIEHIHPLDRGSLFKDIRVAQPTTPLVVQFSSTTGRPSRLARVGKRTAANTIVFPGPGDIPSPHEIRHLLGRAGYRVVETMDLRESYVKIAATWVENFYALNPSAVGSVADYRRWEMYLVALQSAFETNTVTCTRIVAEPIR